MTTPRWLVDILLEKSGVVLIAYFSWNLPSFWKKSALFAIIRTICEHNSSNMPLDGNCQFDISQRWNEQPLNIPYCDINAYLSSIFYDMIAFSALKRQHFDTSYRKIKQNAAQILLIPLITVQYRCNACVYAKCGMRADSEMLFDTCISILLWLYTVCKHAQLMPSRKK